MLKSPTISALSTVTNRSERKSANYFRKSVHGPGGLYTVARARDRTDLFCLSDSLTLSISTSKPVSCFLSHIENVTIYWTTRTHCTNTAYLLSLDTIRCTSTTLHMNNLLHLCTSICCSTNLLLIYNLLHLTLLLCIDHIMYRYCT